MAFRIHRRTVLRGTGVALGLPALELMAPRSAAAAPLPKRYVVAYGGVSTGGYKPPYEYITPATAGTGYEVTVGLEAVAKHGVKAEVGIVTGLKIPHGNKTAG